MVVILPWPLKTAMVQALSASTLQMATMVSPIALTRTLLVQPMEPQIHYHYPQKLLVLIANRRQILSLNQDSQEIFVNQMMIALRIPTAQTEFACLLLLQIRAAMVS